METHPKCDRHDDVMEAVRISKAIAEAVPKLLERLDVHMLGEGHPLLAQRMEYQRSEHEKSMGVLEKLVSTVTVACESIRQLQSDRDAARHALETHTAALTRLEVAAASESGVNQANWKTVAAVSLLVAGNVAGVILALLKLL
jgi:uncharacterized protein involved in exopolysaccharide biosynthesis